MSEEEKKETNLIKYNCPSCGIPYGLDADVDKLWRGNHKSFFCPNGHSLSYKDPPAHEKEIEKLKAQVKELETKLQLAQAQSLAKDSQIRELSNELEIWKPSSKEP